MPLASVPNTSGCAGATLVQYARPRSPSGWNSTLCVNRDRSAPSTAGSIGVSRNSSNVDPGRRISAFSRSKEPTSTASTRQKST